MADPSIPGWLKSLPLAPEYRPTETEFADPIAFISRVERAAAAFGICKVVPPLPKPSRKFVLANLNRSLSKAPELGPHAPRVDPDSGSAVFTTRHQELGSSRRPNKQVWQSGEIYTLDQFEAKSRSFSRSQLSGFTDVTPLLVESLFWRAVADKPISVEYANDVPGSGFAAPREPFKNRYRFSHRRRKRKGMVAAPCRASMEVAADMESTAGWKLSNSPWNLQVIARSPGSLTRFMPDDVPGVTSPMVYIGMLYSWFAWHVEDHELHSLNFLHMGAPKTWYAVPGEYAGAVEEIVRVHGYGGNIDRLAALTMLGEKTNLLSPDVLVASGIPCCRLVQHPGEFVVTFPRAYHVGFSHGFNCGEAANFATPQWLKVAKEAAVRRAAMNYLPMLSHQQLLYLLTVSFIFRVPRELLSGVRSSRLRDRVKEERELLIKKAFLKDLMSENHLLCVLLEKESNYGAVLWDPELLPTSTNMPQSCSSSFSPEAHGSVVVEPQGKEMVQHSLNEDGYNHRNNDHMESNEVLLEQFYNDGDDLPLGLDLDSGSLACVACGILGYPFMVIVQPSERAAKELFPVNSEESHQILRASGCSGPCMSSCPANGDKNFDTDKLQGTDVTSKEQGNPDSSCELLLKLDRHAPAIEGLSSRLGLNLLKNDVKETSCHTAFEEINQNLGLMSTSQVGSISSRAMDQCTHFTDNQPPICSLLMTSVNDYGNKNTMRLMDTGESMHMTANSIIQKESSCSSFIEPVDETDKPSGAPQERSCDEISKKWNLSNGFMRPRIFCLQHALEIEEMLQSKGGARVLIICYSDYLKIKPQAAAVAEEIGIQFKFKDIAIDNASAAELDLINTSIDDEEYEEHGEDWTSKLGLNLKYCVKLRKQSSSNQEQPALALCGILSDLHPVSLVSCLKWHSRKTRTPKVYCSSQSKSHIAPSMKKGEPATRKANNNSAVEIQVYQRSKGKAGEVASKGHGHPKRDASKELGDSTDTLKVDHQDGQNCETSNAASLVESSQEQQEIAAVDSTVNDSMAVQENMIAQGPILECCVDNSMSSRDQQIIQTLSVNNSDLEVELQDAEEPKLRDVVIDSLKSGMQMHDNTPVVDMWQDSQALTGRKLGAQDHNNIELEGHLTSGAIFEDLGTPPNESNIEPIVDDRVETVNTVAVPVGENCGMQDAGKQTMDGNTSSSALKVVEVIIKRPIIVYTRRTERNKNKRKWEEMLTNDRDYCEHFIRSPCEGLRPRSGQTSVEHKIVTRITKKPDRSVGRKGKDKGKGAHKCDIDGCHLSFRTTGDLGLHKSNRCIFKGCRKRFSSHKSAICHHLDHEDERPLKCPWNGCGMSFKWAWARTEHIRLHTGERPYQCKASGCGQTFKFMSDFSRHRRKMGHSVDSIA